MNKKLWIITIFLVILFGVVAYNGLTDLIFQQDEWMSLGASITRLEEGGVIRSIEDSFNLPASITRVLPVAAILNHYVFNIFGLDFFKYGLLALFLVIINSLVVFWFAYKLVGRWLPSIFAALMWLTNPLSYQAVSWFGAMSTAQISFLLFIVSSICLLIFLEGNRKKWLFLSLVLILASVWTKETGVFYVVVFILLILRSRLKNKIKYLLVVFIPIVIAFVIPRFFMVGNQGMDNVGGEQPGRLTYNIFLLPARSLSQVYFSQKDMYDFFRYINTNYYGGQIDGYVVEGIIPDVVSIMMSFYFVLLILLAVLISGRTVDRGIVFISLLSFFASVLPFAIFENRAAILEPRYYIYPALWGGIVFSFVIWSLLSRLGWLGKALFVLVGLMVLNYNVSGVQASLKADVELGSYRRDILETVSLVGPKLGKDIIYYFFTDHTGFYEFQSGFGQTLGVWFYDTGKVPREVLTDLDFWDPSYEGLKKFGDTKYGYFMTYDLLIEALRQNTDIILDNVHSFYWDHAGHSVTDVSEQIRDKLREDLAR